MLPQREADGSPRAREMQTRDTMRAQVTTGPPNLQEGVLQRRAKFTGSPRGPQGTKSG